MTTSILGTVPRSGVPAAPSASPRLLLLATCVFATAAAALIGDPSSFAVADPELALLLRGMAVIKGTLVLAAVALALWRFGLPIGTTMAACYVAGVSAMAFATALIWQLSFIVPAAVVFHAAGFLVLVIAWRDDGRRSFSMRPR